MSGQTVTPNAASSQATFPDPIPGFLSYGSVNILAGASGVGKTCLLSSLLCALRDGTPFYGLPTEAPSAIGYVCADRSYRSAQYWLEKAGYPDVAFYSLADDPQFQPLRLRNKALLTSILSESLDRLRLPPGAFVVVDPLALFMGGNLNDYQSCAVACIEFRRLCTRKQLTLLGTAHAGKQKADKREQYRRLQDRILGSAAQLGYGDTQLYLAAPEETGAKTYTFLLHPHTAPPKIVALDRGPSGLFHPTAESPRGRGYSPPPLSAEESADLLAMLPADGSCRTLKDLLEGNPASRSSLYRRLQAAEREGLIERPVQGQYRRRIPS